MAEGQRGAMCDISPDAGADAAAIYGACLGETSFQDYVLTIGALFCSTSVDGGVESTDASLD
jgi:hypothetical protein